MKYFILSLIFLFPLITKAQRSKVAHINTMELWEEMPEKKKADSALLLLNKKYSDYYNQVNQEIQTLIGNYKNDTISTPAIKADMVADIQNRQGRLEAFKKEAESDLEKKRNELLAPIREKMQKAIDKVAEKNKYDYVLDSSFGNILYTKNDLDNILSLVKKELGL